MSTEDALPGWVVYVGYIKKISLGLGQFNVEFMKTFPKSTVGSYFTIEQD